MATKKTKVTTMKIGTLIKRLERIKEAAGNIPVYLPTETICDKGTDKGDICDLRQIATFHAKSNKLSDAEYVILFDDRH